MEYSYLYNDVNGQGNRLGMFCRSLDAAQRNNAYILMYAEGMEKRAVVDRSKLSRKVKGTAEEYITTFHCTFPGPSSKCSCICLYSESDLF